MLMYLFFVLIFKISLPQENVVSGGLYESTMSENAQIACFLEMQLLGMLKERLVVQR